MGVCRSAMASALRARDLLRLEPIDFEAVGTDVEDDLRGMASVVDQELGDNWSVAGIFLREKTSMKRIRLAEEAWPSSFWIR